VSLTIVTASTTVGTPIAITGIPTTSLLISFLLFETPLPGWIPVSVNWIVLFTLSNDWLAKASITKTKSGFRVSIKLNTTLLVSIPVCPITPGAIAKTLLNPSSISPTSNKWLVTIMLLIELGPRESGVDLSFPSPTIKQLSFFLIFNFSNIFFK